MVRRSWRRPAFRVLAYSTAAALVAVGLTSVAAAADPEPAGPATSSTGTATTPPVAPSTTSPTTAPTTPPSTSPTPTTPTTPATPTTSATPTSGSADTSTPSTSTSTSTPGQGLAPAQVAADPIDDRYAALGGATGALGRTVGGRVTVAGGQVQAYEHGHISWSARTGAWETLTAVDARFQAISGPSGALGFPYTAPMGIAGGQWQWFEHGVLWWSSATGAWETVGSTNDRYLAISGPFTLGFPTRAVGPIAGGSWQWFTAGVIWSSPSTGAWETYGSINGRYLAISGPWTLGFPTGTESSIAGGRWQWFTGGELWWSPSTGAWETYGGIDKQYLALSGPWSRYGFPTGGPYSYYGGTRQDFRNASLLSGVQAVLDATYAGVSASDVWATYRAGCPVGPSSLTLIRLNYWGYDNAVHRGEIIVRSDLAGRVASVFGAALAEHYPIRKMWRVDWYGGDDPASMADDNTSGFNCRQVTGGSGLSPHSYGIAIDLNTLENPYYAGGRWWPTTEYVDRSNARWGMLYDWSKVTINFRNNGFSWGGSYLDYQHYQFVG